MDIVSASEELARISLGDRRLEQRAISVVAAIQQSPGVGFPKVFRDPSQLEAFYRLVNNGAVEPDALLAPHSSESWRRAKQGGESVLVLHDTSEFIYQGEATREGLEKKAGSQSFHGHFALAVAEGEPPVVHGVVGHRSHVREDGVWFEAVEDQEFEALRVGSERWLDLAASARQTTTRCSRGSSSKGTTSSFAPSTTDGSLARRASSSTRSMPPPSRRSGT